MPLYKCQIPDCSNEVIIRSKIKKGEYKGKLACGYCKRKHDGSQIKQQTKKTKDKRQKERSGLPEFFDLAICDLRSKPVCQNCGVKIKTWLHPINNIAHILSKRKYKSVMCEQQNYVILCDEKDEGNNCHKKFDDKISERDQMPVFQIALEKYKKFSSKCLENGKERIIFEEKL